VHGGDDAAVSSGDGADRDPDDVGDDRGGRSDQDLPPA
jgi:hypothetical protein